MRERKVWVEADRKGHRGVVCLFVWEKSGEEEDERAKLMRENYQRELRFSVVCTL